MTLRPRGGRKREAGARPRHVVLDELYPERRVLGPIKRRLSRKARRAIRHSEVAAMTSDLRAEVYYRQNGARRLTPAQRRRIRHKENAGRG